MLRQVTLVGRFKSVREKLRSLWRREVYARLSTQQAFERIYATQHWGASEDGFCSGRGSSDVYTRGYVEVIRDFIVQREVRQVVDLGCGDFRVGRQLLAPSLTYTGVDIVRPLVERNQLRFGAPNVSFVVRDMVREALPDGELALLRQVLQHLSNQQILQVLANCRRYRYLVVTEHLPIEGAVTPNLDKPHGPDIRLQDRSGVFLELPPFNCKTEVLTETAIGPGEVLRTVLITNSAPP